MDKDSRKEMKIVKFSEKKQDMKQNKIEFTGKELEIKSKLEEIDKKVENIEALMDIMEEENSNTIFTDEVLSNIIGLMAVSAASSVIAEYFGLKDFDPNDLL